MKATQIPWLEKGYKTFAYEGPKGLKVERLAKEVGKNKSSFYYLFSDLDIYTEQLLAYHIQRAKLMVKKEASATKEAELIDILVEHKIDLLFSRQLRIHRENEEFEKCFNEINRMGEPALIPIWKKIINLNENTYLAQMVLYLGIDNFYLQITDKTLNHHWLAAYFANIRKMVQSFRQLNSKEALNGSVYKSR